MNDILIQLVRPYTTVADSLADSERRERERGGGLQIEIVLHMSQGDNVVYIVLPRNAEDGRRPAFCRHEVSPWDGFLWLVVGFPLLPPREIVIG